MAKKDTRYSLINNGVYSLVGGFGLEILAAIFNENINLYIYLLKLGGIACIGMYAWRWSKFDKFFRNIGFGIDNIYPIKQSQTTYTKSIVYEFTLPCGLEVEKLRNHQNAMEQWLGRKVDIDMTKAGLFKIEVFLYN